MSSSGANLAFGDNNGGGNVGTSAFFDPLLLLLAIFVELPPDPELDLCLDDEWELVAALFDELLLDNDAFPPLPLDVEGVGTIIPAKRNWIPV